MSSFQLAYGLTLRSDLPIPGLTINEESQFDVAVWLASPTPASLDFGRHPVDPWYTSDYQDENGNPTLKAWRLSDSSGFKLKYSDGIEFIIDEQGNNIWAKWPSDMTLEDTTVYLLGPVLGFVLRLRGRICLHASVICVDDHAVALVGSAGSGKSTTAAAFAGLGYPILTDDVAAITGDAECFTIQPAYPHLRLWPKSVDMLYGDALALPKLVPNSAWDKCYLDLTSKPNSFQMLPLPLGAIYILNERSSSTAAPFIEPMSAADGIIALVTNSYATYLLDRSLRGSEFNLITRLASKIPPRQITPHSDPIFLQDLCEIILRDLSVEKTGQNSRLSGNPVR
jgi:energy-coupling factor transporter ATP-binding protein EcfA2